jgi:DNA-binding NarL/FixJ family response regulator
MIVSRQLLFRHALACFLSTHTQYNVVQEFNCCNEINFSEKFNQVVFIIDADLDDTDIKTIVDVARRDENKVVILGHVGFKKRLVELMTFMADGYLTSDLAGHEFSALLEKVEKNDTVISDSLVSEMVNRLAGRSKDGILEKINTLLTQREKEILKFLIVGATNNQIAKRLVISVNTVKNHVHNILEKLGIDNRTQIVSLTLNPEFLSSRMIV